MTYADSHSFGTPRHIRLSVRAIRWIRLSLGSAVVLAAVALAASGGRSDLQAPDQWTDQITTQSDAESGPVFDGRGKWGGYAR